MFSFEHVLCFNIRRCISKVFIILLKMLGIEPIVTHAVKNAHKHQSANKLLRFFCEILVHNNQICSITVQ